MAYSGGASAAPPRPQIRDPLGGAGRPGSVIGQAQKIIARTNKNRPAPPPPRNNQPEHGHTGAGAGVPNRGSVVQHNLGSRGRGQPVTNPLAPLNPRQIRQQAANTISKAYAGEFSDLNSQSKQAQNLYKTQTADDAYFNQWVAQQAQSMQAQTDTVNQKLLDVVNGIRGSQEQSLNAVPGQLAGQTAAADTGVAPGQLQSALTGLTAPTINAANAQTANEAAHVGEAALAGNTLLAGAGQVALGRIQQVKTGQLDALNKTLNTIAADRTKLIASRTGDIAKEIARLNGIEISKAQYQESQNALEQKLGISKLTAQASLKRAATGQFNAVTSRERAQETARHNSAVERINSAHYTSQAARQQALDAERTRHDKATEGIQQQNANTRQQGAAGGTQNVNGRKVKIATPAQQRTLRNTIGQIRQALIWDINQYHQGDPHALAEAWHDLENGNYMAARTGKRDASGTFHPGPKVPVNFDVGLINAASNTLTQYGARGLTPGDVAFLEGQGLSNLEGYYPVASRLPGGRT